MRYHNITKDDMLNGTGLRVVLWVAGCNHGCTGCHNPITWAIEGGVPFDEAAKNEIYAELEKPYIEGVTLSGGDPLHPHHRDEIGSLIREIKAKFPSKNIWLYTGFLFEEIRSLSYLADVDILVDGRFEQKLLNTNLHWKGSSNQRIIDVKNSLETNQITIKDI